jgi:hypothetical protein
MRVFAVRPSNIHEEISNCAENHCQRIVYLSDAEAEIKKARKEGYAEGVSVHSVIINNTKEANDAARADEREEIIRAIQSAGHGAPTFVRSVVDLIRDRSRGDKPATVEKLPRAGNLLTVYEIADRVNELINALKAKGVL